MVQLSYGLFRDSVRRLQILDVNGGHCHSNCLWQTMCSKNSLQTFYQVLWLSYEVGWLDPTGIIVYDNHKGDFH